MLFLVTATTLLSTQICSKLDRKNSLDMIAFLMITKEVTFIQEYPRSTKSVTEVFPNLISANLHFLSSPFIWYCKNYFLHSGLTCTKTEILLLEIWILQSWSYKSFRKQDCWFIRNLAIFKKKKYSERSSIMNTSVYLFEKACTC